MTTVISPYSNVGFYKAPVTKTILGGLFVSSCAFYLPQLGHLKKYFICNIADVAGKNGILKFAFCRCVFLDVKDLVCGALLLYYFRVFEKRYGSHKFCSKLLITWLLSFTLELLILNVIHKLDLTEIYGLGEFLITGPFGVICPLFVDYFVDIPRVAQTHILGVPITGKTLTYCIGLQMISTSISSIFSGTCGLLAGILYRYNIFRVKSFRIPNSIAKVFGATLGKLVASSPPPESIFPMGATLEIQRAQQLEILEQQILLNRNRDRFHNFQDSYRNHGLFRRRTPDNSPGNDHADSENARQNIVLNENQVQTLVEMGFDRERVIQALQNSGNDLHLATALLLQET